MRIRKRPSSYVAPSSSLAEADPTPANESHSSDYRLTQRKHKLSPFSLSPFRCVAVFGLTILSPFWLSPFWLVAVIVCRRFDGTPLIAWAFERLLVLDYHIAVTHCTACRACM